MTEAVSPQLTSIDILRMTSEVVASYVSNNTVAGDELAGIIQTVHESFMDLKNGNTGSGEAPKPAVSVRKSITPDYIVCLEDGKKLKMLKRYLRTTHGMTPGRVPGKVGIAVGLPHGCAKLRRTTFCFCQKDWPGPWCINRAKGAAELPNPRGSGQRKLSRTALIERKF